MSYMLRDYNKLNTYPAINTPDIAVVRRYVQLSFTAHGFAFDHRPDVDPPSLHACEHVEADDGTVVAADEAAR